LGARYRHPNQNISDFIKSLDNTLVSLSNQKLPCILAGYINIGLAKFNDNSATSEYIDHLLLNNFMPLIVMPTRITARSATIIDHMYYFKGKNSASIFR